MPSSWFGASYWVRIHYISWWSSLETRLLWIPEYINHLRYWEMLLPLHYGARACHAWLSTTTKKCKRGNQKLVLTTVVVMVTTQVGLQMIEPQGFRKQPPGCKHQARRNRAPNYDILQLHPFDPSYLIFTCVWRVQSILADSYRATSVQSITCRSIERPYRQW